ncbi:YybH family protein [Zavarzinella formosa]|uniref:YybH family protein n=1 Tax=Zavarzinella formosa TaxID=360055 RepID=UPI0002F3988D|nr:nuclear transport factor 2 family protein [Zavarzinella formosa]
MLRRLAIFAVIAGVLFSGGYALTQTTLRPLQDSSAPKAQQDLPVREALKTYGEAFNKGDLQTVLGLWTEDAELFDEDGKVQNRAAISESLKAVCKPNGGNKLSVAVKNVKIVGGSVALLLGTAELTSAEGTETNTFEAVMVLNADTKKWQFSRVRDLPPDEPFSEYALSNEQLKPLEWLIGDWSSKEGDQIQTLSAKWTKNRAYIMVEQTVKFKDTEILGTTMMIGYDPVADQLHSWVFDSLGGRGEADWTRDGNSWNVDAVGVTADGSESSSAPAWKFVDEKTFEWSSTKRQLNGQPRPDIKLTYHKTPVAK